MYHFSKFITERLEDDVDGWTQKRDVYEEFKLWYTENEGKDVPKGKELFDFLEKKYGPYNKRRGWRGFRIAVESADEDEY